MKGFGRCTFFLFLLKSFTEVALDELEGRPSLVKKLTAVCGKDGIKVIVRFYHPFTGIVYSDGHYDTPSCVFINRQDNASRLSGSETRFSFVIPADECGTVFHDPGSSLATLYNGGNGVPIPSRDASDNEVYMENTVMFQRNHFIQEQGDLAQTLRCVWQKEIRRPLQATLPLMSKHRRQKHPITEKGSKPAGSGFNWNRSQHHHHHHHHHHPHPHRNSSYLSPSLYQQHYNSNASKKRFKPTGHVESISFGRRNGKSIDVESITEHEPQQYDHLNNLNLTALPFKAYARNSVVPSIVPSAAMAKTMLIQCTVLYVLSHLLFI